MERMERRWSEFTREDIQKIADTTLPEKYSDNWLAKGEYTPPLANLGGKEIKIYLEKDQCIIYKFAGIDQLSWTECNIEESDVTFSKEYYEARQVPDSGEIYMIQYYCHGSVPPTAYTVVVDFQTGLVTVCKAQFCLGYNPREVTRTFRFGILDGYEDTGKRHEFTTDLVGKSILWTYHEKENVRIRHIYTAPLYYTYIMKQGEKRWVASNPADYIKINDHMYIFTFVEERQAGTQGFFLINTETLHDVGSFFGVQATGLECCTFGAKGEWSSPYDES